MRKNLTIFCVSILTLLYAGSAFAFNSSAYFQVDSNLATAGYQNSKLYVLGIGPAANVGFALYSQQWESAAGITVAFEWDATKATYQKTLSGKGVGTGQGDVAASTLTINGASTVIPVEKNILETKATGNGQFYIGLGEVDQPGSYTNDITQQFSETPSHVAVGLIYFAVFKTAATFKTTDQLTIKSSVSVSDEAGQQMFLGYRYFSVNQVSVKTTSWGDVKNQFKDF
jgi:hypothetical protein